MNAGAQCTFLSLFSLGPQPMDSAVHIQGAPFSAVFSLSGNILVDTPPAVCFHGDSKWYQTGPEDGHLHCHYSVVVFNFSFQLATPHNEVLIGKQDLRPCGSLCLGSSSVK